MLCPDCLNAIHNMTTLTGQTISTISTASWYTAVGRLKEISKVRQIVLKSSTNWHVELKDETISWKRIETCLPLIAYHGQHYDCFTQFIFITLEKQMLLYKQMSKTFLAFKKNTDNKWYLNRRNVWAFQTIIRFLYNKKEVVKRCSV